MSKYVFIHGDPNEKKFDDLAERQATFEDDSKTVLVMIVKQLQSDMSRMYKLILELQSRVDKLESYVPVKPILELEQKPVETVD